MLIRAGALGKVTAPGQGASASAIGAHYAGMVVLHGAIGGISSDLQGGSFALGFYAAGLTRAFGPAFEPGGLINISSSQARIFAAAVVGGTASELSGGKFSNSTITGAFSRALNDEMHRSEIEKRYGEILKAANIDLASNADEAAHMSFLGFIDHVKSGGPWDY
ncbi:hypothetical protein [Salinisphaera sp. T5B8]|uniref:hypothetical protein n=1 Tax=Salinisphaera sp. T5B8 TaxID=1304154 RepID=UPI00333E637A